MSDIIITVVITALSIMVLTMMVMRTELRMDCENLGQFRLNDTVYDCNPKGGK